MSSDVMWMVRAGQGASFVDDFFAIGFMQAGEAQSPVDKSTVIATMQQKNPNGKFMMAPAPTAFDGLRAEFAVYGMAG